MKNRIDTSRIEFSKKNRRKPMDNKTIQDVIDTMTEEQKLAVEAIILCVIDDMSKGKQKGGPT